MSSLVQPRRRRRELAGYYHSALLSRLPTGATRRELTSAQAGSWLNEFLALEERCTAAGLPAALKCFLRAGAWLGASSDHALAREVIDRYPRALLAAARQIAAEFAGRPRAAGRFCPPGTGDRSPPRGQCPDSRGGQGGPDS